MLEAGHLKTQSQQVIANVYRYFQEERDNGGPTHSLSEVYKRVAAATGVGLRSIQSLNAKCKRGQKLITPGKRRPNSQRRVIAVDDLTKCKIRQIIFDLNTAGSNFTLNRILSTIRGNGVAFEGGRTSLGTLLKQISMRWLKANNCRLVLEHREVVAARRQFLRRLKENREAAFARPVVYIDETWITLRQSNTPKDVYKCDDVDSMCVGTSADCEPNGDRSKKRPGKRTDSCSSDVKRFLVINAGNERGFIEGAGQLLSGGRRCSTSTSNGNRDTEEMTADRFEKWLQAKLIPSLPNNSVVVMDNAWYHNLEMDKPPSVVSSKSEIMTWLQKNGVCCTGDMIKAELLQLVNQHRPAKRFRVDEMLERKGHSLLRLPPHHCDLNPFEQIYAKAKRYYNERNSRKGVCNERFASAVWSEALSTVTVDDWTAATAQVRSLENDYWSKDDVLDGVVERLVFQGGELSSDDSDTDISDLAHSTAGE